MTFFAFCHRWRCPSTAHKRQGISDLRNYGHSPDSKCRNDPVIEGHSPESISIEKRVSLKASSHLTSASKVWAVFKAHPKWSFLPSLALVLTLLRSEHAPLQAAAPMGHEWLQAQASVEEYLGGGTRAHPGFHEAFSSLPFYSTHCSSSCSTSKCSSLSNAEQEESVTHKWEPCVMF